MARGPRPVSRRALLTAAPLFFLTAPLSYCGNRYKDMTAARQRYAKRGHGPVVIGAVQQLNDRSGFVNGVKMAAAEINAAGGLLGRHVLLDVTNDGGERLAVARRNARDLASDEALLAVISCESSATAIGTSVTYQYEDVLCLEVSSTSPRLTAHHFDMVFRTIPNDIQNAKATAAYMEKKGYRKTVIVSDRSVYGLGLSELMRKDLDDRAVMQRIYLPDVNTFWELVSEIKGSDFDSVFLVGAPRSAAHLIKVMRTVGVTVPIVGGDSLDSPLVWSIAGKAAEGLVVPTVFDRESTDPRVVRFVTDYQSLYLTAPDTRAAKGYGALKLLATVVASSKRLDPEAVAAVMRFRQGWKGAFSTISFDAQGDVVGRKIYFQTLRDGIFIPITE